MALGKLGTALTAGEILGLVSGDLEKMESELRLDSVGNIEAVSRIARHLQGNGGKRLRPILLLVSCRLYQEPNAAADAHGVLAGREQGKERPCGLGRR